MSNVKSHVKAGDKAPDFTTLDDAGTRVSLSDLKGSGWCCFSIQRTTVVMGVDALSSSLELLTVSAGQRLLDRSHPPPTRAPGGSCTGLANQGR